MNKNRQPVHTVYGGAHLFTANTNNKLSEMANKVFKEFGSDGFSRLGISLNATLSAKIYARVEEKLKREAIEDYRIDFEDGYGWRPDSEEDKDAKRVAEEVARAMKEGLLPPFFGIRVKGFSSGSIKRALRTLDLFFLTLSKKTKSLPENFVVTLPKITHPIEVKALVLALKKIETKYKLKRNSIKIELMIETPQAIFDSKGLVAIPALVAAAEGRCRGVHFGTYDYTSSLGIISAHQGMNHPACEFAKNIMQVSLAGSDVQLSDGATTLLPVGDKVDLAWKLSFTNISNSLANGFYQGWDLHPAQIPIRYIATYFFFLVNMEGTANRLENFLEAEKKATSLGGHFDDEATARGLFNFFRTGLACGALAEKDLIGANFRSKLWDQRPHPLRAAD